MFFVDVGGVFNVQVAGKEFDIGDRYGWGYYTLPYKDGYSPQR